jgi:hypothetical protein
MGSWLGPKAGLEAVEKRKILLCRESHTGRLARSVARRSLYQLLLILVDRSKAENKFLIIFNACLVCRFCLLSFFSGVEGWSGENSTL